MNVLTSKFPTKVKIDDEIFELNTDFRNCLKIMIAYEDKELLLEEKHVVMLNLLYKNPEKIVNIRKAIEQGVKFLNCGEEQSDDSIASKAQKRVYSFEKDSKYIYSAIKQTDNVDLEEVEYLHWWKFAFLFMDIGKDCLLNQLIYLRKKKQEGKLTDEERKLYVSIKEIVDLDYQPLTNENSEFLSLWGGD